MWCSGNITWGKENQESRCLAVIDSPDYAALGDLSSPAAERGETNFLPSFLRSRREGRLSG